MSISVIISTYNSPDWLERVIWGYSVQTFRDFELVIADDGSTNETKERIDKLRIETSLKIKHIWHEDNGFQKTIILNKAIQATDYDYLIFTDGDCIPRNDFVQVHADFAESGYFLSGGYFMLPMNTSLAIRNEDVILQNVFKKEWLMRNGLKNSFKSNKLTSRDWKAKFLNSLTPTNASWNGHNSSAWKSDLLAVNGFDERMQYGGEDRELGERMFNNRIKSKQIRYSAICVHLDHERGYKTAEMIKKNEAIRNETKFNKSKWTNFGIEKQREI